MAKTILFTGLFLIAAAASHAERERIFINSDNTRCRIEEHQNTGNDGISRKLYWVFAEYLTRTFDRFEAFLIGSYDHQEAVAACKVVDELVAEASAAGGKLEVESKTYTCKTRIQGSEGSVWAPRPACHYDIYTTVLQTLEFPKNLVLKHETISKERFTDECP
jgi:hypothetical protein